MKVFKNLFGKNEKIHVDEIAVAPGLLLGGAVIVESGSNEYGTYIKFGNGWMIVVCEFTRVITTTVFNNEYLQHIEDGHGFPKEFISPPTRLGGSCDETRLLSMSDYLGYPSATHGRLTTFYTISRTDREVLFKIPYFGKWK